MVWIHTIAPEDADGRLAEAYAWQSRKLGRPTEFTQLGSLAPEVVHARLILYRASEGVPSRLSPVQKLLISYLTSILNATPHCAALARTELCAQGHERLVQRLDGHDYTALRPQDQALAEYVEKLTLSPGDISLSDVESLRGVGFNDLEILDANNQCAHLNYTNRVANGLGLLSEPGDTERTRNRVPD